MLAAVNGFLTLFWQLCQALMLPDRNARPPPMVSILCGRDNTLHEVTRGPMNHVRWLPSRAKVQGRTGKGPTARKGTGTKNSVVWGVLVLCRWGLHRKESQVWSTCSVENFGLHPVSQCFQQLVMTQVEEKQFRGHNKILDKTSRSFKTDWNRKCQRSLQRVSLRESTGL